MCSYIKCIAKERSRKSFYHAVGVISTVIQREFFSFVVSFFLRCSVPSPEYGSCKQIVNLLCVFKFLSQFGAIVVLLFSSYSRCVSLVLLCNPDLFFLNLSTTFEHRYTLLPLCR